MDWLAIIPLAVIGVFLVITWEALSPIRFIQQMRAERKKRQAEWEALQAQAPETDEDLFK